MLPELLLVVELLLAGFYVARENHILPLLSQHNRARKKEGRSGVLGVLTD